MKLELLILTLQNIGDNLWYFFRTRAFRILLLKMLWFSMATIGGMAFQELFKMKWQESFAFANFTYQAYPVNLGVFIANLLSFLIGFLFALVPEGTIIGLIASGSNTIWNIVVATAMSIAVSAASSYVFITSDASAEYIGFIVAASIMGQVFVIILSDSLKNNENTVAIAAKEKEFETINEHLSKQRMAEIFAEEKDFENNLQNNLETKDNVVNFVSVKERKFA